MSDIEAHNKNCNNALVFCKKLIFIDDNNANYHFKYGGVLAYKAQSSNRLKAFMLVGDIKKHLHKAVTLDSKHIEARWALIELYVSLPKIVLGSEENATKYASELLKISIVDGYLALGHIAERYNKLEKAENYYKKSITIGRSKHTYKKLSSFYEKTNQPQKALNNYEKTYANLK